MVINGFLAFYIFPYLFYILLLPGIFGSGYFGLLLASSKRQIILNDTYLSLDKKKIEFSDIDEYHPKFSSLKEFEIMSMIQLKLSTGEIINITISNFGKKSKHGKKLLQDLVNCITLSNSEAQEVNEVILKKRTNSILRVSMIALVPIVIAGDIVYLIAILLGKTEFNYRIILVNVFALSLIHNLRKKKA